MLLAQLQYHISKTKPVRQENIVSCRTDNFGERKDFSENQKKVLTLL